MKQIEKQNFEIVVQLDGQSGIERIIEEAGHAEDGIKQNVTQQSSIQYYNEKIKKNDLSMLEFGTVYLMIPKEYDDSNIIAKTEELKVDNNTMFQQDDLFYYFTTTEKVIREKCLGDLKMFVCNHNQPSKFHHRRIAVRLNACTDVVVNFLKFRGNYGVAVSESSNNCIFIHNAGTNVDMSVVKPLCFTDADYNQHIIDKRSVLRKYWDKFRYWMAGIPDFDSITDVELYNTAINTIEFFHHELLLRGWKDSECSMLYPYAVNHDMYICMFDDDWIRFFNKFTSYFNKSEEYDSDMTKDLADRMYNEFVNNGYILDRR